MDQNVTPWEVSSSHANKQINYAKLVEQFGCQKFTKEMVEAYSLDHILFRRGMVFAHRDFQSLLQRAGEGKPVYLYTGRGPSSRSMHLGHAVPFLLCRYLQKKLNCKVVIQLTDDEKFIWKDVTLEDVLMYGRENAKDIIAFGFDPKNTFIFSNVEYSHKFLKTTLSIEKSFMLKDYMKVFGFTDTSKVGQVSFPSRQMAPCFPSSFPSMLPKDAQCLVPASIDQDPYFRLARDISHKLGCASKPAMIYTYFLPALQGIGEKMSASADTSSIYLSDTPEQIKKKINKYAFSGGRDTLEEHRKLGGDPEADIAFQYLRFFLEDDALLQKYEDGYKKGEILSGEMKKLCIETLQGFVKQFQESRAAITEDVLSLFFSDQK
ncbi:tryptophanyl-tRNA synthetase [Nematocida sp. AWRm77]|nr:tryptophanyl-tRNA synthetase [Nematocida sp. AWRm77]